MIDPIMLRRAVRFALTGVLVTCVHAGVAIMFIRHIVPAPPLANGVAFIVATVVSYTINTLWSFSGQLRGRTLAKFIAVSIVGLSLAILVAWVAEIIGLGYLAGICAVALTIPTLTFVLHNFWTYR